MSLSESWRLPAASWNASSVARLLQQLLQAAAQVGLARRGPSQLRHVLVERLQPLGFLLRAEHRAAGVERFLVQAGAMTAHLQPFEGRLVVGREPERIAQRAACLVIAAVRHQHVGQSHRHERRVGRERHGGAHLLERLRQLARDLEPGAVEPASHRRLRD